MIKSQEFPCFFFFFLLVKRKSLFQDLDGASNWLWTSYMMFCRVYIIQSQEKEVWFVPTLHSECGIHV